MDDKLKKLIQETVREELKSGLFSARKLTDTPTDKLQVTPRGYVTRNFTTATRPTTSVLGEFYFDRTAGKPAWWNGTNYQDASGGGDIINKMATTQGSYKGTAIKPGNDASISAQIKAIDAATSKSSTGGGSQAGAVNAKGQVVGAGGKVLGMAKPEDTYKPGARPALMAEIEAGETPSTPLDPNAQAPQGLIDQVNQVQKGINSLANPQGMSLKTTPTGVTSTPDLSTQYKQAHQMAINSGVPASQSAGAGGAVANNLLGKIAPQQEQPSILGGVQETDSMFDSLFVKFDEYFSPENQRVSLVDEYKKMSKNLGIDDINAELIDAKRIIDGTEDDIREEIQKSGGLVTESQVQSLANARNKSLIKNYNTLLDTKNAAMEQLGTMMNLSIQDRQFAEAEFDRKMNFAFKVQEFKERAQTNATNQMKYLIDSGFGGAILSNPYDTQTAERLLGVPSGGLSQIVTQKKQEKDLDMKIKNAQLANLLDKGDTVPTVKSINGVDMQWNPTTKAWEKIDTATVSQDEFRKAQAVNNIQTLDTLKTSPGLNNAVGPGGLFKMFSRAGTPITGVKQDFIAEVEKMTSQLTLDNLIKAKGSGATFGALSEGEMNILSSSASKIGTWRKTNDNGQVVGYNASEKSFKKELDTISNSAKLDYILQGGDPTSIGVQVNPDGSFWTMNSDGSMTQLR